jgi:UPF0755 protein
MIKWLVAALLGLLLLGAAAAGAWHWLQQEHVAPRGTAQPVRLEVPRGASARSVLAQLEQRGLVADARRTEILLRLQGRPLTVRAGEYEFPAGLSTAEALLMIEQGRVVLEALTVVEGWTFADLRRALEVHPRVVSTLEGLDDAQVMAALGRPDEHPEGRFFPDTYRFAARTTDLELLRLAYRNMARELEQAWAARQEGLPLSEPYEALILASIIEKETGLPAERARIGGVFTRRLRIGMRLQTDPTVIYGIGPGFDGNIRRRDLVTDTPYNTYTRHGLPPTPIALPGRAALYAAVQPEETGELYFVATGLGDGSHHFSRTLEEHNAAVQRYLARLRATRAAAAVGDSSPGAPSP